METACKIDEIKTIVLENYQNGGLSRHPRISSSRSVVGVENIIVWGGNVFNCGEDELSRFVYQNKDSLLSFTYLPIKTKGGEMLRPFYFRGDRIGKCLFPNLCELRMPLFNYSTFSPLNWGWITPVLRSLCMIGTACDTFDPTLYSLWVNLEIPKVIVSHCPKLDIIAIGAVSPDKELQFQVHILIKPAKILTWEKLRLLHVILFKETIETCPVLSVLQHSANLQLVLSFLNCQWVVKEYQSPEVWEILPDGLKKGDSHPQCNKEDYSYFRAFMDG